VIVEILENVRTLRGSGCKRKYRYTRRIVLKCDICGECRESNATKKIQQSLEHPCRRCIAAKVGKKNTGRSAYNAGHRKPFEQCNVGKPYINSSGYTEVYVGNAFDKKERRDKYRLLHRLVAEVKHGNTLEKHVLVHHVNGDKRDNHPDNLFLCEMLCSHRGIHDQLEQLSMHLVKMGIIQFDHSTGKYYIPCQDELFNKFPVVSRVPCFLAIEKTGQMRIVSQSQCLEIPKDVSIISLEA
jgi:hypothetical protein